MYVKKSYSRGRTYLSLAQGYRQDGKVKSKTIEKLGYLDELEKLYDDPIAHFRKIAKERTEQEKGQEKIELLLNSTLKDNTSNRKNLGYFAVKQLYSMLGINTFFQKRQRNLNIDFNLNGIFSLLTFNRFLYPSSKIKAFETRDIFFESHHFSKDSMYRALDHYETFSEALQKHLHEQVSAQFGFDRTTGYYDVTNFYFEIPYNDENEMDESGNIIKKGYRQKGPSKENRRTPITQMGLLMDKKGLPMAFHTFSGGASEKTSLLPVLRRVKRDFEIERMIVVADRGLNTSDNTYMLAGKNHSDSKGYDGYVYGQSIKGGDKDFKKWALDVNDFGRTVEYDEDGNEIPFVHKSRLYAKKIQIKNSKGKRNLTETIYQKQMVYYSLKYALKQKKDREQAIEKAKDLIANPGKYNKATSVGAASYVKNIKFIKGTGEISDASVLDLNLEKIEEEKKYDGFYSIVTSETNLTDKEMRDIYRGLWEIEESFRIMKGDFSARPVYLQKEPRIDAHFLICFVSLLLMRLLEMKLDYKYSVTAICESLRNYSCSYLDQNYYLFDYRDEIICDLEKVFDINLSKKIMSLSEIKKVLEYAK